MEIFYSQEHRPPLKRQTFRNPRFFTGVEPKARKVVIHGDWPEIAAAYKAAKVPVEKFDAAAHVEPEAAPAAAEPSAQ